MFEEQCWKPNLKFDERIVLDKAPWWKLMNLVTFPVISISDLTDGVEVQIGLAGYVSL